MSGTKDVLFGREVSGTPLETRGLTSDLATFFQNQLATGQLGNMGQSNLMNTLGFDIGQVGLGDALREGLGVRPNTDLGAASDLFRELNAAGIADATARGEQSILGQVGGIGGRFSTGMPSALSRSAADVSREYGELESQFLTSLRGQDIQREGIRNQLAASMLGTVPALQQAGMAPFELAARFGQAGAPNFQQGIAGDLLGAAGNIAAGFLGVPRMPTPGFVTPGDPMPAVNMNQFMPALGNLGGFPVGDYGPAPAYPNMRGASVSLGAPTYAFPAGYNPASFLGMLGVGR